MDEFNLPNGYSIEKKKNDGREYTFLYKEGKIVLALPAERCLPQKIEEVIQQTQR